MLLKHARKAISYEKDYFSEHFDLIFYVHIPDKCSCSKIISMNALLKHATEAETLLSTIKKSLKSRNILQR